MRYDAEGLLKTWLNTASGLGPGAGLPLRQGAHLRRLRGPYRGTYVLLSAIGGSSALSPEKPGHRARVSGQVYGVSKEGAAQAAVAYANALETLRNVTVAPAVLLFADAVTGPLYAPDVDEERYLVDADLYLA